MAVTGRPRKKIDWELFESVIKCSHKMKIDHIAEVMKVHKETLVANIKEKYGCNFEEIRDIKSANIRYPLIQKAIQMAMGGNATMMIFCLKNMCGWTDSPKDLQEIKEDVQKLTISFQKLSDEDLKKHGL